MELVYSFSVSVDFRDKAQVTRPAEKCQPTEQIKVCMKKLHDSL